MTSDVQVCDNVLEGVPGIHPGPFFLSGQWKKLSLDTEMSA